MTYSCRLACIIWTFELQSLQRSATSRCTGTPSVTFIRHWRPRTQIKKRRIASRCRQIQRRPRPIETLSLLDSPYQRERRRTSSSNCSLNSYSFSKWEIRGALRPAPISWCSWLKTIPTSTKQLNQLVWEVLKKKKNREIILIKNWKVVLWKRRHLKKYRRRRFFIRDSCSRRTRMISRRRQLERFNDFKLSKLILIVQVDSYKGSLSNLSKTRYHIHWTS